MCSIAMAAASSSAGARPIHHHHKARHSQVMHMAVVTASPSVDKDPRYSNSSRQRVTAVSSRRRPGRRQAQAQPSAVVTTAATTNDLVAEARKYLGTNPTNRRTLWCGAFMDLVLKETGHKGGGNLALGYLHYGTRVSGPQVGAIAVMSRRGGGHVGVVSGIDANGNPIIISGNHRHTTAEAVYPRRRIAAYVVPSS